MSNFGYTQTPTFEHPVKMITDWTNGGDVDETTNKKRIRPDYKDQIFCNDINEMRSSIEQLHIHTHNMFPAENVYGFHKESGVSSPSWRNSQDNGTTITYSGLGYNQDESDWSIAKIKAARTGKFIIEWWGNGACDSTCTLFKNGAAIDSHSEGGSDSWQWAFKRYVLVSANAGDVFAMRYHVNHECSWFDQGGINILSANYIGTEGLYQDNSYSVFGRFTGSSAWGIEHGLDIYGVTVKGCIIVESKYDANGHLTDGTRMIDLFTKGTKMNPQLPWSTIHRNNTNSITIQHQWAVSGFMSVGCGDNLYLPMPQTL